MAKRQPPIAGYWISCSVGYDPIKHEMIPCKKVIHDSNCTLGLYHTDGTLKNMKYVHHSWGTDWCKLLWTCFPFQELKNGSLQHYPTLQDLKNAIGTHRFNNFA